MNVRDERGNGRDQEKLSYREKANSTPRFSLLTIENYFNIHGIITEAPSENQMVFNIISFNIHNNSKSSNKWETGLRNLPRDLQSRQYVRWD